MLQELVNLLAHDDCQHRPDVTCLRTPPAASNARLPWTFKSRAMKSLGALVAKLPNYVGIDRFILKDSKLAKLPTGPLDLLLRGMQVTHILRML